jgi:hypothetical protein
LRLALVSFEYVGPLNGGGIGTYVRNAAQMLADRGYDVEVFCAGDDAVAQDSSGVRVTSIAASRDAAIAGALLC